MLLNGSLDPALLVDPTGRVLAVNDIVSKRLGRTHRELVGASISDLFPPEIAAARLRIIERVVRDGQPVRYLDGHYGRHFDSLVSPIRDSRGRVTSVAVYSRDITERHRLEQELLNISTTERQRLGNDLHDTVGQQLTGIRFLMSALADRSTGNPEVVAGMRRIEALISETIEAVRCVVRGLSPVHTHRLGLAVALRQLAGDAERLYGVACRADLVPETMPEIDGTVATQVYRIASEAIANAVKHGRASQIDLSLHFADGSGTLVVGDDGSGLAPDWEQKPGMGVRIMRHRASVVGAVVTIERRAAGGTVVTCRFGTHLAPGFSMPGGNTVDLSR
jgi:two-component system, LuxR family, sensor kinase FixL